MSFHSDWGLLGFQADAVAEWVSRHGLLCAHDTGLGKTYTAMGGLSWLVDEGAIRCALVCCEQAKIAEWMADLAACTDLHVMSYTGSPAHRAKVLAESPQVLVSTYETARNDLLHVEKKGRTKIRSDGPLLDWLDQWQDECPVAIVYDESSRLGNRGSGIYKSQERLLHALRKGHPPYVLGLSATPIESSPENIYNQVRLIAPDVAPKVAEFEEHYVSWRDPMRPSMANFQNLGPGDHVHPWVTTLADALAPAIHRKSKTDLDVVEAFPSMVEKPVYVDLDDANRGLYDDLARLDTEVVCEDSFAADAIRFGLLRQVAGHPRSLLSSESDAATSVIESLGAARFTGSSAKLAWLVDTARQVVDECEQMVVFTFYGRSILPYVASALEASGRTVAVHHGGMDAKGKDEARRQFAAGEVEILVSSDAGARGINLPHARRLVNYDLPLTYARLVQRMNRISRMGSPGEVTVWHLVARGTVEEAILTLVLKREDWHGRIVDDLGDDLLPNGYAPSALRRQMFASARSA